MTVFIDKFWIEGVLTEAYPRFIEEGGADLDKNGAIEGKEVFEDFNKDGVIGDRDDYKEYLRQNRSQLSAKIPFFKWGEKLSVDNRIHQAIYLESDIHPDTQIASAYVFIADLVGKVDDLLEPFLPLPPLMETQVYYAMMMGAGILFKAQDDSSLLKNINKRELDCDTSSFVTMAIGDERGVRLQPVLAPDHVFLRGKGKDGSEFDLNYGITTNNKRYGVDPDFVARGIYLKTLDDSQLESLFLVNRGSVLNKLGRNKEALASYNRAIAINPNDALAHYNRGAVLEKLGRDEEALASFNRVIAIDPNYANAHDYLGFVLVKLGRYQDAMKVYERACQLNPALLTWSMRMYLIRLRLLTVRVSPIPGGLF